MTGYHDGLPIMPPAQAAEVADRLRIQILGVRAGWSAWAAREADTAGSTGGDKARDARWRKLMNVDGMLRAAESQLEMAARRISEEVSPPPLGLEAERRDRGASHLEPLRQTPGLPPVD